MSATANGAVKVKAGEVPGDSGATDATRTELIEQLGAKNDGIGYAPSAQEIDAHKRIVLSSQGGDEEKARGVQRELGTARISKIVRGAKFVDEVAVAVLKDTLSWRKEKEMDSVVFTPMPRAQEFNDLWPTRVHGWDSAGHLVLSERVSEVQLKELARRKFPEGAAAHMRAQLLEVRRCV